MEEGITEASREVFWNIGDWGNLAFLFMVIPLAAVAYGLWSRYRLWRLGQPDNRFEKLPRRFIDTLVEVLSHKRSLREAYPGSMHFFMFWGAALLLIGAALDGVQHITTVEFITGRPYLWLSLIYDLAGLMVLTGAGMAIYRRYVVRPPRLDNQLDDAVVYGIILILVIGGFALQGFRIAVTEVDVHPDWAKWSIGGWVFAKWYDAMGMTFRLDENIHKVLWWTHGAIAFAAIAYVVPRSKLSHIIFSPVNSLFRSYGPRGALVPITDFENAETFGVSRVDEFTWKQLLDTDACTRCGRCQDNCPATQTSKALSPKKMTQDIKANMLANGAALLAHADREAAAAEGEEIAPPEVPVALIGGSVLEEEIWDCTTCRACQEHCPVYVEHIQKIIDMRRYLVLVEGRMPETVQGTLRCLEQRGHPCRGTQATRLDWAAGIDVPVLGEDGKVDVLYFVGCAAALEDRNMKVATAFGRVMKAAGVNFGILGMEETCCGDTARRMGNEYLFQMMAQQNIETMKGYGVTRIVTACPHCFNALKNEYPQLGGDFEVMHHSQFIASLLAEGRLRIDKSQATKITYHDSCYLGRYNDVYASPRNVLGSLKGAELVEMTPSHYKSFCCGAGGGHAYMEETGTRINQRRLEHALATEAGVVGTACPYCLQMFEDAIRAKGVEETFKALDLAELVAQALPVKATTAPT